MGCVWMPSHRCCTSTTPAMKENGIPNKYGGNGKIWRRVDFLRSGQSRDTCMATFPSILSVAEESTSFGRESPAPPTMAGSVSPYKWDMGWMNDTLSYMQEEPVHRKFHHDKMTFGLVYAFNENFVLPLSHDEVVHGKSSLLGKMPGDEWQRFANLRAYYAAMYCHPGKKLLFMGAELAQYAEWHHDRSLDWHLLQYPLHQGVQSLVRDLNRVYRDTPALYEVDFEPEGFAWIDWHDHDNSVFSWLRRDAHGGFVVCVANFTPVIRYDYVLGVPAGGNYREIVNTDSEIYGGSNIGNFGSKQANAEASHGHPFSLHLTLPPLATLIIAPQNGDD